MLIWPEASSAQNSMAAVSAEGSTVCVLIRRLNSSQSLDGVGRSGTSPLARWQPGEGEEPIAGFFEAVSDRPALEAPLAQESLAAVGDLLGARGIDHVGVVGRDLLVQPVRGVGQQVPVLVD